ncbi:hypothetical protein [uncultured Brachyspira sp.]|uniref:hypothetical protein n=1 Tax=uncultured Brachyspira sp. TaxID=221953 RepID=UPI0025E8288C|nr:hypothetical protein [uncultured Brachyspira sp.]
MILENIYYTNYYKNHRIKYEILFEDKYFEDENINMLNDNYYIMHKKYSGYFNKKDIIGYERNIFKISDNSIVYNYKSDDAKIFKIINCNDNEYFIFNRDLSGFSILNLKNKSKEFNLYYNKPINYNNKEKGIIVFSDFQYNNNQILFYVFYLSKSYNRAYKRDFDYMLFHIHDNIFNNQNYINLISIRKTVSNKYNYSMDFNYKSYFNKDNIIAENILTKEQLILNNDDFNNLL